jgi:hypothetical protein
VEIASCSIGSVPQSLFFLKKKKHAAPFKRSLTKDKVELGHQFVVELGLMLMGRAFLSVWYEQSVPISLPLA